MVMVMVIAVPGSKPTASFLGKDSMAVDLDSVMDRMPVSNSQGFSNTTRVSIGKLKCTLESGLSLRRTVAVEFWLWNVFRGRRSFWVQVSVANILGLEFFIRPSCKHWPELSAWHHCERLLCGYKTLTLCFSSFDLATVIYSLFFFCKYV